MKGAQTAVGLGGDDVGYPYLEEVNQSVLRAVLATASGGSPGAVLDVGCGYGALGREFRSHGFRVWGIERDPTATAVAGERLDRVIVADLADGDAIAEALGEARFDVIVFSDVLEHIPTPRPLVTAFTPYLRPGGRAVVSVPNVANWQTRFGLLFGRFDYRDTGVLDRTHVRFFTRRSTVGFLRSCGLEPVTVDYTPMLVRALLPLVKRRMRGGEIDAQTLTNSRPYRVYLRFVLPVERMIVRVAPGLLAFQIVVTAVAAAATAASPGAEGSGAAPGAGSPTGTATGPSRGGAVA